MMNREKAITGFFALVGSGIIGITLALNGYSYWSLAWQQFAYICIINIGRLYYVRWMPSFHIDLSPIREMIGFSSKILITNIINQVNNNILSFIFGRLFTAGAVGNYTQAAKWNTMGLSLISGTIVLGLMRANIPISITSITIGKFLRYVILIYGVNLLL